MNDRKFSINSDTKFHILQSTLKKKLFKKTTPFIVVKIRNVRARYLNLQEYIGQAMKKTNVQITTLTSFDRHYVFGH